MTGIDLTMFVEFGVGLAGFSGVVVAFGRRSSALKQDDRFRIMMLLAFSLFPAFVGTLPTVLGAFGLSDTEAVQALGIFLSAALAILIVMPFVVASRMSSEARSSLSMTIWYFSIGGTVITLAWNALNLIGWPNPISAGPIVATLVWLLFLASLMFLRLLLVSVAPSDRES